MELRQIRHLVALSEWLSYARAAEDLGLSQPALSRSIQMLEREFGIRLFDRNRSGVRLAPHARTIVEQARMLLANLDNFQQRMQQTAHGQAGRLKFGMAPLPARALLSSALTERISDAPELLNDVVVRNVEALWPMLTAGEIEFFVSAEGQIPEDQPVRSEPLGNFTTDIIVRSGHPLLMDECRGQVFPLLLASRAPRTDLFSRDLPKRFGNIHIIEDYEVLTKVTATTNALWISSLYSVHEEIESGALCKLEVEEFSQFTTSKIIMYSLDRQSQSPGALALKPLFRRRIRELGTLINE